uniref:Putative secreted protein n=1 Tax=Anopheles marajoara TaxID=58244 RepID=A0A2M4C8Z9_9DIPT
MKWPRCVWRCIVPLPRISADLIITALKRSTCMCSTSMTPGQSAALMVELGRQPREEQPRKSKIGYTGTMMNFLKGNISSGCFTMGYALSVTRKEGCP